MENKIQQTFVIIKPDAIERGLIGKIISRFEDKFLRITVIEIRWKNKEWCKQHYSHVPKEYYPPLEDFMTAAPIIGMVLMGPEAIWTVRQMIGKTNSLEALPGTVRGDYGSHPIRYNLVHASDSQEAVAREVELFLDDKTDISDE